MNFATQLRDVFGKDEFKLRIIRPTIFQGIIKYSLFLILAIPSIVWGMEKETEDIGRDQSESRFNVPTQAKGAEKAVTDIILESDSKSPTPLHSPRGKISDKRSENIEDQKGFVDQGLESLEFLSKYFKTFNDTNHESKLANIVTQTEEDLKLSKIPAFKKRYKLGMEFLVLATKKDLCFEDRIKLLDYAHLWLSSTNLNLNAHGKYEVANTLLNLALRESFKNYSVQNNFEIRYSICEKIKFWLEQLTVIITQCSNSEKVDQSNLAYFFALELTKITKILITSEHPQVESLSQKFLKEATDWFKTAFQWGYVTLEVDSCFSDNSKTIVERLQALDGWQIKIFKGYSYAFWAGKDHLMSNPSLSLLWFKKSFQKSDQLNRQIKKTPSDPSNLSPNLVKRGLVKNKSCSESIWNVSNEFLERDEAACYIGLIYAMSLPCYSHHINKVSKWFVKGNMLGNSSGTDNTSLAYEILGKHKKLIMEWLKEAMKGNSNYAYVLSKLSELSPNLGRFITSTTTLNQLEVATKTSPADLLNELSNKYVTSLTEDEAKLNLPYAPMKCVVAGGGEAGILTALLLARLKTKYNRPLFKLTVLEQHPHLFYWASMVAARLHLGFEYPLDDVTALDCLTGAMFFIQMLPQSQIYTPIQAVTYILDRVTHDQNTDTEGQSKGLNLKKMEDEYTRNIQRLYQAYYDCLKFADRYKDTPFFGDPRELIRSLTQEEVGKIIQEENKDANTFAGGFVVHERGINPAFLGAYLEEQLKEVNVQIHCSEKVSSVQKKIYGYNVKTEESNYYADIVINATGDGALELDMSLSDEDHTNDGSNNDNFNKYADMNVHLRGIGLIDIRNCEIPRTQDNETTAIFGLLGKRGGMFSPYNSSLGLVYWPSKKGSYIQDFVIKADDPDSWGKMAQYLNELTKEEKERRLNEILNNLKEKYPCLKNAQPLELFVRPTLSFGSELSQRPQAEGNQSGAHGLMIRASNMKATYSPVTAILTSCRILEHCKNGRNNWEPAVKYAREWLIHINNWLTKEGRTVPIDEARFINLPSIFCLPVMNEEKLRQKAQLWAKTHGWPDDIVKE